MRSYVRQFIRAANSGPANADLFREADAAERRRHHLRLLIGRKARQLGIHTPAEINNRSEQELSAIRLSLSKQIALRKSARLTTEEKAA